MILADTSVWVDHLRSHDDELAAMLEQGTVLGHPWVAGELALGSLVQRADILRLLRSLPQAVLATEAEIEGFVEQFRLFNRGIGYVDVALLAATRLTPGARLWTRDRRLAVVADELGLATPASGGRPT